VVSLFRRTVDHDGTEPLVARLRQMLTEQTRLDPATIEAGCDEARLAWHRHRQGDPGWLLVADGLAYAAANPVALWDLLRRGTPTVHVLVDLSKLRKEHHAQ
jgi:hypothetical protein